MMEVELTDKQEEILTGTVDERMRSEKDVNRLLRKEQDIIALIADANGIDDYEGARIDGSTLVFTAGVGEV